MGTSNQSQVKRQTFTFDFAWDHDNGQEEVYENAVCGIALRWVV